MDQLARIAAVAALVVGALTAPPAGADNAELMGFTCGSFAIGDPTGLVEPDPLRYIGMLDAWGTVAHDYYDDDSSGGVHLGAEGITSITQHCWLQLADFVARHTHDTAAPVPTAHCDFTSPGPAISPYQSCVISYRPDPPWQEVYLCTWWELDHGGHHEDLYYDFDDSFRSEGKAVHYPPPPDDPIECFIALS